eukprot:5046540-Pleurochrysis_carterae.AAC.1
MSHQDIVANINAGHPRARPMRMHPSLPITISSVNRLLLHKDSSLIRGQNPKLDAGEERANRRSHIR